MEFKKVPASHTPFDVRLQLQEQNATFGEGVGAAFRDLSIWGPTHWDRNHDYGDEIMPFGVFMSEPDFDVFEHFKGEFNKAIVARNARSPSEADYMIRMSEAERENKEVLSRSGIAAHIAGAALGIMSNPFVWLTGGMGALYRATTTGAKIAKWSAIGGGEEALNESMLQTMQNYRTLEESLYNVGGGALFGGVLGPFTGGELSSVSKRMAEFRDGEIRTPSADADYIASQTRMAQAGSDEARLNILNAEAAAQKLKLQGPLRVVRKWFPGLDLAMARSPLLARMTQFLISDPYLRAADRVGHHSIEVMIDAEATKVTNQLHQIEGEALKKYSGPLSDDKFSKALTSAYELGVSSGIKEIDDAVVAMEKVLKPYEQRLADNDMIPLANQAEVDEWRKSRSLMAKEEARIKASIRKSRPVDETKVKILEEELKRLKATEFSRNVDKARKALALEKSKNSRLRKKNKQVDESKVNALQKELDDLKQSSSFAEIDKLSKALRAETSRVRKIKARNAEARLARKRAKRLLEARARLGEEPTHVAAIPKGGKRYIPHSWFVGVISAHRELFKQALKKDLLEKAAAKGKEDLSVKDLEFVEKVTNSLTGNSETSLASLYAQSGTPKWLKDRKVDINPNNFVDVPNGSGTVDFLERGVTRLMTRHLRDIMPRVVMKEKGFDKASVDEMLKQVHREYEILKNATKSNKERNKLDKEEQRLVQKFKQLHEVVSGKGKKHNAFSNAAQMVRDFNTMRLMGRVTVSSVTDIGNIAGRHGLFRTLGGVVRLATNMRALKLSKEMSKKMFTASEIAQSSRFHALNMDLDNLRGQSGAGKAISSFTRKFILFTGMNHWNQYLKDFSGVLYMDEILRVATQSTKSKRQEWLLAGFSEAEMKQIGKLWKEYGESAGGIRTPNIERWVDEFGMELPIAEKLRYAVRREADMSVVTPGAGDLPLAARTETGKVVAQFKSFSFAAMNRIFIPSVQRLASGDLSSVVNFAAMTGMGTISYMLKQKMRGEEISDDPNHLLAEGLDRGGFFGLGADIYAIANRASNGMLSVFPSESAPLSRYYSRPPLGDIFGPSVGFFEDAWKARGAFIDGVTSGDISDAELKAMKRMIPYQNFAAWNLFMTDREQIELMEKVVP